MAAITNYYEELAIRPEMTIEEINDKLSQLEVVWNQRLLNEPEKANAILALISEARNVFVTAESKVQYDHDLQKPNESQNNSDDERLLSFKKWYASATSFFDSQQLDLAKTSIERALSYYDPADENDAFLDYAADIYRMNGDYATAMHYINEALVINPTCCGHHTIKGAIYLGMDDSQKACDSFNMAISEARKKSDDFGEGMAQSLLAQTLLYNFGDYASAETAAKRAVSLGDPMGIGQQIAEELSWPKQVSPSTLNYYRNEKCELYDEINQVTREILQNNPDNLTGNAGWILSKKKHEVDDFDDRSIQYKHEYIFVLGVDGKWKCYHCESLDSNFPYEFEAEFDADSFDDFLIEFDYEGSFSRPYNRGDRITFMRSTYPGDDKIKDPNYSVSNGWFFYLMRNTNKGQGLLDRLITIRDEAVPAQQITKPRPDPSSAPSQTVFSETNNWRMQGRCQYCGGDFKGVFGKKCSKCGKPKDY